MLFKLSNLNSNLALTLGYLNPTLNNSAQNNMQTVVKGKIHQDQKFTAWDWPR